MRALFFIFSLLFIMFFTGCSKEEHLPTDRLDGYITAWENKQFTTMYEMLRADTKTSTSTKDFIDRYEKIYNDLKIENIKITYPELDDEAMKDALENKQAIYELTVTMDSLAGKITFEEPIELHLDLINEEEKVEEWMFDWDERLIFPELTEDAKIRVENIQAKRGEILDRNKMPLAINDVAFEVGIVPNQFENEAMEKEQIATLLRMSIDAIDAQLDAPWVEEDHFVPLHTISQFDETRLSELLTIPAITYRETTGRVYPSGKAAAHLTGYIGKVTAEDIENNPAINYREGDMIGKRGLEQLYEETLRGKDGVRILIEQEEAEEVILAEREVQDGEHLQITVDVNVQEKVFDTYGENSGTAATIDPKTGEILALVSSPAFDPNELTYGISSANWEALTENKKEPLLNRFTATFAPGSVIKPVTAAIGLKSGELDPQNAITIDGLTWAKKGWGDVRVRRVSTSDKPVDLRDALIRSDNIYFARKAIEIGTERFTEQLKNLGFEQTFLTGYPVSPSKISNSGVLQDEIMLANSSYGQAEIELSALHLALLYTMFINDGTVVQPALLSSDPVGKPWIEKFINEKEAAMISDYLREVVTDGTAKVANNERVPIAGKTGTAELKLTRDSTGNENGWFIGYPTDKEDILIAMMIENVESIGSSSYVAEKVAKLLTELR